MTRLGHDRYCDEIVGQTDRLRDALTGADLSVTVPGCPDWTLGQLARHVGGAHRWVEMLVRTRATADIPEEEAPGARGPDDADPAALDAWLEEGARKTAATLRAAGPDAEVWSWAWEHTAGFWARRMALETVVHRADAAMAAQVPYEVEPLMAADTIDEWLRILAFAQAGGDPEAADLRGGGRSIHLHATDTSGDHLQGGHSQDDHPQGIDAEWLIEFGEDGFTWRHDHRKATVALRGPLTDLMLVLQRRLPADSGRVEVLGDAKLLDFWLERTSFG
ncbi:maleylpyruvate isomerase family mycothiol-dependent enzyme [Streptomyces liangshanensis]|uniref:Maleylpyruvate isomerase family mycothiol-dependent enzyme n=1 Tax=Streptomyces liangshanensis TaxID=2717324 RepID=A0A6G9H3H7_9ACTN|nr:maleylpyruvate isomerase family mycothiol-dependent enzyme [Streptomyces liangshanensis]QIQ05024.1 maleylpyruvate isomerase family mycothiol-dependent enzyme [Streptomyces liangshanensis]